MHAHDVQTYRWHARGMNNVYAGEAAAVNGGPCTPPTDVHTLIPWRSTALPGRNVADCAARFCTLDRALEPPHAPPCLPFDQVCIYRPYIFEWRHSSTENMAVLSCQENGQR